MLYAKSLTTVLSLVFFATAIFASPIPDDDELDPSDIAFGRQGATPPLPSIQDCKDHLNVAADTSLFYSGPGGYAGKAKQKIKDVTNLKDYKILGMLWTDKSWQDQWQNDEQTSKKFFDICSQAMAEASSGTVYVLLPPGQGTNWKTGTVWDGFEWPNLGSGVTKVVRINPDNTDEEVIKDTTQAPAPAPAPPPAFASGVCSFHLVQWDYGFGDSNGDTRYEVEVRLLDNSKAEIGFQPRIEAGNAHPLGMTSGLPLVLVVTPEAEHDYIQFAYGSEFWATNDDDTGSDVPNCSVGKWDGSDYPSVSLKALILIIDLMILFIFARMYLFPNHPFLLILPLLRTYERD